MGERALDDEIGDPQEHAVKWSQVAIQRQAVSVEQGNTHERLRHITGQAHPPIGGQQAKQGAGRGLLVEQDKATGPDGHLHEVAVGADQIIHVIEAQILQARAGEAGFDRAQERKADQPPDQRPPSQTAAARGTSKTRLRPSSSPQTNSPVICR